MYPDRIDPDSGIAIFPVMRVRILAGKISEDTNGVDFAMLAKIKVNAELANQRFMEISDLEFAYDAPSVQWLDGYIERQRVRPGMDDDAVEGLVGVLGCWLGECIIACYGGEWAEIDGQWGVQFDGRNAVFPISKMKKQFQNGSSDSVSSFFETIPVIFSNR